MKSDAWNKTTQNAARETKSEGGQILRLQRGGLAAFGTRSCGSVQEVPAFQTDTVPANSS